MSETATAKASARLHDPGEPTTTRDDVPAPLPLRRRRTVAGELVTGSRRNSISLKEARSVLQYTTQSVLEPTDTESPTWHTIPLAFAVLPAIGGVLFTGGNYFITDVMLLFLVAVFLHWLVKFPWEWYHSSQILPPTSESPISPTTASPTAASAASELRLNSLLALTSCFLGPILGGLLLHTVRTHLSRPSEGLVSNFNLTIFVLAAELRPVAQVVKLIRARTLYLQSCTHQPPPTRVDLLADHVDELAARVGELTALTARAVERGPDLDALNRAVRRYEKKEAIHSAHTENRILEIDSRLNDVLTLAAAASARRDEVAVSVLFVEWVCAVLVVPFSLAWRMASLPARAVETVAGLGGGRLLAKGRGGQGRAVRGRQVGRGRGK